MIIYGRYWMSGLMNLQKYDLECEGGTMNECFKWMKRTEFILMKSVGFCDINFYLWKFTNIFAKFRKILIEIYRIKVYFKIIIKN